MASRAQYSDWTKQQVSWLYPLCLTRDDRIDLAEDLGIESLAKLYNLGSRLEATRGHDTAVDEPWSDVARLMLRDDPETIEWLPRHDRYITNAWRHLFIEQIAFRLGVSETAVAYRARQLGLRNVCAYWDAKKVIKWLGIDGRELVKLANRTDSKHSLELFPCCDSQGAYKIMLVSTMSLARVFAQDGFWKVLVDERGADRFFIKEVMEGAVAVQMTQEMLDLRKQLDEKGMASSDLDQLELLETKVDASGGITTFEPNAWVSHGHTALNPRSSVCFGWFFDGSDEKMIGWADDPRELAPSRDTAGSSQRRAA